MCTRLIWLRIGYFGGFCEHRNETLGSAKGKGSSGQAEQLLAS
jgi:hypothetical protein